MTDKELLELAAKAAGYSLVWGETYYVGKDMVDCTDMPYIRSGQPDVGDAYWNPLTDDGDALRLAVRLNLSLSTGPCIVKCNSISGALRGNFIEEDSIYQDSYAATRRAIVRAAAEIGRAVP